MKNQLKDKIEIVLIELHEKEKLAPNNSTYSTIARQLEFLKECIDGQKDIENELHGRELNFSIVASRNMAGPEEALQKKIGDIGLSLVKLNDSNFK